MEKNTNRYEGLEKFYYFENDYCDPKLTDVDKPEIKALSDNHCAELWNEYVSESKNHLMLMNNPEDGKIKNEIKKEYNWLEDWNDSKIEAFNENVKNLIDWKDDDSVIFFWNKTSGIASKWALICKYWISFLYEDEANIMINPKSSKAIILSTNGNLSIADRL
jgi:hypothetical protein